MRILGPADEPLLVDQPPSVTISGCVPGAPVKLQAALKAYHGLPWTGAMTVPASSSGTVAVPDRLFSFLEPGLDQGSPAPQRLPEADLELHAEQAGRVATRTIRRAWHSPGVTGKPIDTEGSPSGWLYAPAPHAPAGPGVLLLGGSGGRLLHTVAALLASRGVVALAQDYTTDDGNPGPLERIPIERAQAAVAFLAEHPRVNPGQIGVFGVSRGAELALIVGTRMAEVAACVVYAPSSHRWSGLIGRGGDAPPAWTEGGEALPYLVREALSGNDGEAVTSTAAFAAALAAPDADRARIEVERVRGALLLVSGQEDGVWPSSRMAECVVQRVAKTGFSRKVTHLSYPEAGHALGTPYVPTTVRYSTHRLTGQRILMGGRAEGDAVASADAWPKVLLFLETHLGGPGLRARP